MKPDGKVIVNDVRGEAFKTKSGTKVYVVGGTPKQEETRAAPVVKYYNKNFTIGEQKKIGNVIYDLNYNVGKRYDGRAQWLRNNKPNHPDSISPGHKRVGRFNLAKDNVKNESTITHELIHIRRYAMGCPVGRDEKKVIYESSGRVSHNGYVTNFKHFGPDYFMTIPKYRKMRSRKQIHNAVPLIKQGMLHDRVRLTGSMFKSGKGERFNKKVERTFPTSFIKMGRIIK